MDIEIKLNKKEIAFLKALKSKPYPINAFSGRRSDDKFKKKWDKEIDAFIDAGFFDKVNNGEGSYWQYDLNQKA